MCAGIKPLDDFPRCKRAWDGRFSCCRSCNTLSSLTRQGHGKLCDDAPATEAPEGTRLRPRQPLPQPSATDPCAPKTSAAGPNTCRKCGAMKPAGAFHRARRGADELRCECRDSSMA